MNITSGQKKAAIIGAAVSLIAGAAFVYFDPLGLDLLGLNKAPAVVQPVALPRTAAPAAKPPVVVPPPAATPVVVTPVQALQPPLKLAKTIKTAKAKPERSKTADLRHCLELETNAAIAKCAGE